MPANYKRLLSVHRQAMSQRSQFVPTISHALSISLLRNAQSPSLRRKLLSLVSNPVQPPNNDVMMGAVDDRSDFAGNVISQTLGRIIEERLWTTMHHYLYRPPSALCILPPQGVDAGDHGAVTVGMVETSTSGPAGAESVMDESLSFTGYGLDFFDDHFEDLFEDMPDEGEYEELEALFSDITNERNIDDDFEDLLKEKPSETPDQKVYTGVEAFEMDFDIAGSNGTRYWEDVKNTSTGDLLDERQFDQHEISDRENEDMLI